MARGDLHAFLVKLDNELQKSSKTYRKYTSDVKPHTFYLSRAGLRSQILSQMERDGIKPLKDDIEPIITKYFKNLKQAFTNTELYGVQIHRKRVTNVSFSATFSPTEDHRHYFTHKDSFTLLKSIMYNSKLVFNSSMSKLYKKHSKEFRAGVFLDVGHADQSTVFDSRVSDQLLSYGEVPPNLLEIEEVATIFSLIKIDDDGEIHATLQSASANRSHGAGLAKDKVELQGQIGDALLKLEAEELTGSDSLIGRKKKKLRKEVIEPFLKMKGATIVAKDLEYKSSAKTPVKEKNTRKISGKRSGKAVAVKKRRRAPQRKSAASTMLQMITMINKRLPERVRDNMQSPALQNQTGRFVDSVKVTEVVKTPKGYPSVGYTYRKSPYQVFEVGAGSPPWATPERDPRKLIDRSIREIAREMAIGRLFTRRV